MNPLLLALMFLLVALAVYLGRFSARVRAEHSRVIAAPAEALMALVEDLSQWQRWNPWLALAVAPQSRLDGQRLSWALEDLAQADVWPLAGRKAGALRQQIRFALPFKMRGRLSWQFEAVDGGTRVRWRYEGRVAFSLRAFASTVQAATAFDLRLGLDRLAACLEAQAPAYTLDAVGVQQLAEPELDELPLRGALDALPGMIAAAAQTLREQAPAAAGAAVLRVRYLRTQLKLRRVEARIGIEPVAQPAASSAEPSAESSAEPGAEPAVPATQPSYLLRYEGRPEDLELAWYLAMQRLRLARQRPDPRRPPFERYLDEPRPGQRGRVDLCLPVLPA